MVGYMISILSLIFSLTSVNTPRFLKNVWPFFNIKNEDIKSIYVLKQICFRIQSIYGNILSRKTCVLFSSYIAYQKHPSEVFRKKDVLKNLANFTGKHLYRSLFLIKTLTQVFSCEICKNFKNTYFEKHMRATVSGLLIWLIN